MFSIMGEYNMYVFTIHKKKKIWPINLCNVSYKIFSKVLCQRLKKILLECILETQSPFVAGQEILDNTMITQEMFHALTTKPSGKNKWMAIKTDMSKAYDRIKWILIQKVMENGIFLNLD